MNSIINKISKQLSKRIDEWAMSNGCTIDNPHKFRIEVKIGIAEYERTENSMKIKVNNTYTLYPARGRNAKKPISVLKLGNE